MEIEGDEREIILEPENISIVESNDYNELENKPQINGVTLQGNKTTSDLNIQYSDIANTPTIGNGTITFNQGGVLKGTITVNQTGNTTIDLDATSGDSLPSQTGHAGEFLTTDGTDASWAVATKVTIREWS